MTNHPHRGQPEVRFDQGLPAMYAKKMETKAFMAEKIPSLTRVREGSRSGRQTPKREERVYPSKRRNRCEPAGKLRQRQVGREQTPPPMWAANVVSEGCSRQEGIKGTAGRRRGMPYRCVLAERGRVRSNLV